MDRLLTRETVDLIVLDLMMPGEDGLSICRRLRAANDRTPIIMLTAKGEDVDRIVGLEVGADDYLPQAVQPARTAGPRPRRAAPPPAPGGARRAVHRQRVRDLRPVRVRPGAAHPAQERRGDRR